MARAQPGRHQPDHGNSCSSRASRVRCAARAELRHLPKAQIRSRLHKIAEDIITRTYDTGKLDAGVTFEFKVVGRNSLGDGPESAVASITVS